MRNSNHNENNSRDHTVEFVVHALPLRYMCAKNTRLDFASNLMLDPIVFINFGADT